MSREPIAIIGRSCLFPNVNSPAEFWEVISKNQDRFREVSKERLGINPQEIKGMKGSFDKTYSTRCSYIDHKIFLESFRDKLNFIDDLDPYYHWTLWILGQALDDAKLSERTKLKSGLILANLTFALESAQECHEDAIVKWLDSQINSRSRETRDSLSIYHLHQSARPAELASSFFGLGLSPFALDAACASSLYAVDLACQSLWRGDADAMIAMGVNRSEMVALQVGFSQLGAYSEQGQCLPFDQSADGLVVGEGGGALVLKKLSKAQADGNTIYGLIRGTGTSCDGQDGGLLAPSHEGQVRALREAYHTSGVSPADVRFIECHGTATARGDATEINTLKKVFYDSERKFKLGIGSVKSNFGHCLSAAGMASLMKMLQSIEHGVAPATKFINPGPGVVDNQDWLELVSDKTQLETSESLLVGVNGFGFGGTNAHIILQEYRANEWLQKSYPNEPYKSNKIAIVGAEVEAGQWRSWQEVLAYLQGKKIIPEPTNRWPENLKADIPDSQFLRDRQIGLGRFRISPKEMERLLPQQLLMLELSDLCLRNLDGEDLDYAKTGVLVGLNFAPNITNHTLRFKASRALSKLFEQSSSKALDEESRIELLSAYREAICEAVNSDDVVGDIPNFPANRINAEFNLQAPSYVVFQEDGAGLKSLQLAIETIRSGRAASMLVGATDLTLDFKSYLAGDPVRAEDLNLEGGAMVLLEDYDVAIAKGHRVLALIDDLSIHDPEYIYGDDELPVQQRPFNMLGYMRSAQGLFDLAMSSRLMHSGYRFIDNQLIVKLSNRCELASLKLVSEALLGRRYHLTISECSNEHLEWKDSGEIISSESYSLKFFQSNSKSNLIEKLKNDSYSTNVGSGDYRLAIHGKTEDLESLRMRAIELSENHNEDFNDPRGIILRIGKKIDESTLAFVYPGFGNLYPHMGKGLLHQFPGLLSRIRSKTAHIRTLSCFDRLWSNQCDLYALSVFEISFATTFFQCLMTDLAQNFLGLRPAHVVGFSGGEINCLSALDVWNIDKYYDRACKDRVFSQVAAGEFECLKKVGIDRPDWGTLLVTGDEIQTRKALEGLSNLHLLMVNSPAECMIGGSIKQLLEFEDKSSLHTIRVPIPQVYHSDLLEPWRKDLEHLWSHSVSAPENVKFYSHARARTYALNQQSVSKAITNTCVEMVRFEPMVIESYAQGARVFLELGPQASVLRHIKSSLGSKSTDCHFISLNTRERDEARQFFFGLGQIAVLGFDLPFAKFLPIAEKKIMDRRHSRVVVQIPAGGKIASWDTSEFVNLFHEKTHQDVRAFQKSSKSDDKSVRIPNSVRRLKKHKRSAKVTQELTMSQNDVKSDKSNLLEEHLQVQQRVAQIHSKMLQEMQNSLAVQEALLDAGGKISDSTSEVSSINKKSQQVEEIHGMDPSHPLVKFAHLIKDSMPHGTVCEAFPHGRGNNPDAIFDRQDCLNFGEGRLGDVFGPEYAVVDEYKYRTRYPSPPYLLVDRVMAIDGKLHEFKPSTVVTEFDVAPGDWFLVDGRVPICVCIESGQADLFLISYVGIDHKVVGERVYRLLGADFTFFDEYPKAPCTLRYEIKINSYVQHDDTWLFFFEGHGFSNGKKFIQWKNGCAGYFTPEELSAKGVVQVPDFDVPSIEYPFIPVRDVRQGVFGRSQLEALVNGDLFSCFGKSHVVPFKSVDDCEKTFPQWANQNLRMVDEISIDKRGGKHGLGYIQAILNLDDDHWYFTAHFATDPVMPGTLMLDGCLQVLEFYLLYLGFGFQARGGRFQPVIGEEIKVKCRGQVIPGMKDLKYYLHVKNIEPGSRPKVYADALITSDGKEVVHIENLAVEIVYDGLPVLPAPGEQAYDFNGRAVHTNETQLIELTVGKPSRYFGSHYDIFDRQRQISRMPNPPYDCITRVLEVEGKLREVKPGNRMVNEFDMARDDWYFRYNHGIMPFCVLNEVVLQPCGLLPQLLELDAMGSSDRFIRNLGGRMITHQDLPAQDGVIRAEVILKEVVNTPTTFMVKYDGKYHLQDGILLAEGRDLHFGFFSQEELAGSPGLTWKQQDKNQFDLNNQASERLSGEQLPLPDQIGENALLPKFPGLFFDRIVEFLPSGGKFAKGLLRVEKLVDPEEWIFYSHFYMDPVVPGSYSLDAVTQVLQYYILLREEFQSERKLAGPGYFRTNHGHWMNWQYRGQILQHNEKIVYEVEIQDEGPGWVMGAARVYVDNKFIYELSDTLIQLHRN